MRVDDMLKDYKEWGKGDLGAIIRAAKFVEDQNQDLHDTLAQVTEENGRLREAMQVALVDLQADCGDYYHLFCGCGDVAIEYLYYALEGQDVSDE